jgi:hypothetical protein
MFANTPPTAGQGLVRDWSFWQKFKPHRNASYFDGFKNKDVAFFHPESKTLIEADLLFNFPCNEQVRASPSYVLPHEPSLRLQYSKAKSGSGNIPFGMNVNPWSWLHSRMVWSLGVDKE